MDPGAPPPSSSLAASQVLNEVDASPPRPSSFSGIFGDNVFSTRNLLIGGAVALFGGWVAYELYRGKTTYRRSQLKRGQELYADAKDKLHRGDIPSAVEKFFQALSIFEALLDQQTDKALGQCYFETGAASFQFGLVDQSIALFGKSLAIWEHHKQTDQVTSVLISLAEVFVELALDDQSSESSSAIGPANEHAQRAFDLMQESKESDTKKFSLCLCLLGRIKAIHGDVDDGVRLIKEAIQVLEDRCKKPFDGDITSATGAKMHICDRFVHAHVMMAQIFRSAKRNQEADDALEASIERLARVMEHMSVESGFSKSQLATTHAQVGHHYRHCAYEEDKVDSSELVGKAASHYESAAELYAEAHGARQQSPAFETLNALAQFYDDVGKRGEGASVRSRMKRMNPRSLTAHTQSKYIDTKQAIIAVTQASGQPGISYLILLNRTKRLMQQYPDAALKAEFDNPKDPSNPLTAKWTKEDGTAELGGILLISPPAEMLKKEIYSCVVYIYPSPSDMESGKHVATHTQFLLSKLDGTKLKTPEDYLKLYFEGHH